MSTQEDNGFEQAKLPVEASAALAQAGGRLFEQLDEMRKGEAEMAGIDPLDPDALVALRKKGDLFIEELAEKRRLAGLAGERSKRRRRWLKVAALIGFLFVVAKVVSPPQASTKPAPIAVSNPEADKPGTGGQTMSDPIPEPSTGVLAMVGGLALAMRRRR